MRWTGVKAKMTALMHAVRAGAPAAAVQVPHIAISRISPYLLYFATMCADAMPPLQVLIEAGSDVNAVDGTEVMMPRCVVKCSCYVG